MDILDKVKQIVADQLGIDEDEVLPEASLLTIWVLIPSMLSS